MLPCFSFGHCSIPEDQKARDRAKQLVVVFVVLGRQLLSLSPAILLRRCSRFSGRGKVGIAKDDVAENLRWQTVSLSLIVDS